MPMKGGDVTIRRGNIGLTIVGAAAVLFGGLTVLSGGQALFGSPEARAAVGDVVPFVLWFNFAAGFVYVIAGIGLVMRRPWAVRLSAIIAFATLAVFAAFGVHVLQGGAYEIRTVGAMALRSVFWIAVAVFSARAFRRTAALSGMT